MKTLKTYIQFLNEKALPLSIYKHHAYDESGKERFNRERYADIFKKYKEKYDGDRNAFRIYLPLVTEKRDNPVEKEIRAFLAEMEYEILDYIAGSCKFKTAKNPSTIGKILTKLSKEESTATVATELMKKFVEDPERKAGSGDLEVCVSRHPYDIIGSDSDRDWENCMTLLIDGSNRGVNERINELEDEISKLEDDADIIGQQMQELRDKISDLQEKREEIDSEFEDVEENSKKAKSLESKKDRIDAKIDSLEDKISELDNQISEIYDQQENLRYDINDIQENDGEGENVHYLKQEVEHGSLISYLIRKDDRNIKKPLAVLNIKPYVRDGEIYLNACKRSYSASGAENKDFMNTVRGWLNEVNEGKQGMFTLHPEVYSDEDDATISAGPLNLAMYIEDNELSKSTKCDFINVGLTSLEGIELLSSVKILNLSNNRLKSLNGIEKLTELQTLHCDHNEISDITSLYELSKLKKLFIDNNQIKVIDISKLKQLQELCINCNNLNSITIGKSEINYLDVSSNDLTLLDVSGCKKLNELYCDYNKIERIYGIEKTNLTYLNFQNNPLKWPVAINNIYNISISYENSDDIYMIDTIDYFNTYEFQKKFMEYCQDKPKRLQDLLKIDGDNKIIIDKRIVEEYGDFIKKHGYRLEDL